MVPICDEETTDWQRPKRLRNNHLFVVFAPVKKPKIVIAVVVEHASYADTIAGNIVRYYMNQQKALRAHEKITTTRHS